MDDRDPAGPTIDGQLGAGEYRAWADGTGSGFGGVIGQGVRLWVDSAADGTIGFLLDQTGQNCNLGPEDSIVLYLDTRAGGIHTTYHLTDASDGGRRAVSGFDGVNRAELGFELGFEPDFALVVRGDSGSLYELVENGPHVFVKSLARAPLATFGSSCIKEFGGFTMADVGAGPGHVLAYLGTLINAGNAYRSNEWLGPYSLDGDADVAKNIGPHPTYVYENDFNIFQTYESIVALHYRHAAFAFDGFGGTGFEPAASVQPAELCSNNWAMSGFSDGALPFGGTGTSGDFARGLASAPVVTAGAYSFDVGASTALGFQQDAGDFDPGTITLRVQNLTGKAITGAALIWELWYRNDTASATTVKTGFSADDVSYVNFSTFSTPAAPTGPQWMRVNNSTGIFGGFSVAVGGYLFVRFTMTSDAGALARDEVALDGLRVVAGYDECTPWQGGDLNGCTIDSCDPVTGFGVHQNEPAGKPCKPNSLCFINGTCNGSGTCNGVPKCVPPPPECLDPNTSRSYNSMCSNMGVCSFPTVDKVCMAGCDPVTGLCIDPCKNVTCNMPPPPFCGDAVTSVQYAPMGTCNLGTCNYTTANVNCPFGCDQATGLCSADPCAGVVCNMPPSACHVAPGTCNLGSCQYAPAPQGAPCDDGDPKTVNDTCDGQGKCTGSSGAGGAGGGASASSSSKSSSAVGAGGASTSSSASGSAAGGGHQGGAGGGGGGQSGGESGGCGCALPGDRAPAAWPVMALIGLAWLRRRRRR